MRWVGRDACVVSAALLTAAQCSVRLSELVQVQTTKIWDVAAAMSMLLPMQVIRLKGALNEKEMELIELREQHMQLVVSTRLTQ